MSLINKYDSVLLMFYLAKKYLCIKNIVLSTTFFLFEKQIVKKKLWLKLIKTLL